ncbi:hypothetical protein CRENBAI_005476 [Crenichthys baileyi]|uniref:Uncharacterized protein n=1 Tax=Crenichthys baileyi TaxID=28760 RepID=A0AAV9S710_9TELE
MPVTNPLNPPRHRPARHPDFHPGHVSQYSSTPPSPPNHLANGSSPSLPVHERETCASRVIGPGRPSAPGQAQPASRPNAGTRHAPLPHPPHRSPVPRQGPEPQKEASEEGHHRMQKTGHPANPTPQPRRCPSMTATHTPAWHTLPHQAGRPASQPLRQSEATSQSTLPGQNPPSGAQCDPQPTDQALMPGTKIQRNPCDPKRAETPVRTLINTQYPTPTKPQTPTRRPTPSPSLRPQTTSSKWGCGKTPSLPLPAQM